MFHFPAQESWGKEARESSRNTGPHRSSCSDVPSTTLNILTIVLHRPGEGLLSEGKAWNPNCAGFWFDRGTRRALGSSSSPAVGRSSGLTSRQDRLRVQLPAEDAPSLACLCDECPDEVGVGGSRSIPPEQNLPSHHHRAIPGRDREETVG